MNSCAVCDAPTIRAVHDHKEPSKLVPYCSDCLDQRPIPRPKDTMAAAPLAADTVSEATLANDQARRMLEQLRVLPVTPGNMDTVGAILIDVKEKFKKVKARQDAITKPMRDAEKSVRDLFRPALNALAEAEAILKQGISDAHRAQLEANRAAMALASAAVQQGDVRGAALAAQAVKPTETPQGITTREVWTFRVTQPEIVPRELCSPDETKIRSYIAAGGRDIPGVVIELGTQVSVRTG